MSHPTSGAHPSHLPASRRRHILDLAHTHGAVRIADVAHELNVSAVTIRRDIAQLAAEGLLTQVRGGATAARTESRPARHTRIGLIAPSLDFFWPTIIQGAHDEADARGLELILQGSTFSLVDNLNHLHSLVTSIGLFGVLLAPTLVAEEAEDQKDQLLSLLDQLHVPTVLIERHLAPSIHRPCTPESVVTDHYVGGLLAVQHLVEHGHRRIALVTDKEIPSRLHIERGWRDGLRDMGADPHSPHLSTCGLPASERTRALTALLSSCRDEGTTAVLAHSDEVALLLVELAASMDLRIPEELSVITYDDEIATLTRPELTAICPPKEELGRQAVALLDRRITQPQAPTVHMSIEPQLIERGSVAPARR